MTLQLESALMRATIADLRQAAGRLAETRERADRRVDALLDGGWRGAAAESYREAWIRWRDGCRDVAEGLSTMGDLLEAMHRDTVDRDEESGRHLALVADRIVERLA